MRNLIEGVGRVREERRRAVWVPSDQQWVIVGVPRQFKCDITIVIVVISIFVGETKKSRAPVCSDRNMPTMQDRA
ncbi:unnamed protein product [Lasius platythorax]|uniref:Uncharacterized protein n=2 Tax=Lasius TaxID=488720 RepID=A0A0J7NZ89_LASNI|nr:hypothetical protein RF55_1967 [Lasius niger]